MSTFQTGWRVRLCELLSAGAMLVLVLVGCEKKEKVLDIETPGLKIEIEKSESGIEVEAKRTRTEERTDDKTAEPDDNKR